MVAAADGVRTHIVAAIPEDFPPTYFRDPATGQPTGFAVDVMNEVAARAGLEVTYIFGKPWDELQRMLLSGQADVLPGLVLSDERQRQFIFTGNMETISVSFATRSSHDHAQLPGPGMRIGVIRGSLADEHAQANRELVRVPFDSLQHLLMELLAGRLDFALCPEQNIRKLANEAGFADRIHFLHPPAVEGRRAIALRPEDAALRDRLDRALGEFCASPEYQRLFTQWWGQTPGFWTVRRVLLAMGAALTATVVVLLVLHYLGMRRSAAALRLAQRRRESIFHGSRDAILLADPASGRIVEVNRAAESLFGQPAAELVGVHQSMLHPSDLHGQLAATFRRHAAGELALVATEIVHRDGSRIPVEIDSTLVTLPDGSTVLFGAFRDVRERVRLEDQLRQSEKMMAVGQLAGGIAHDFNNQLAGIMGYAELLAKRSDGTARRYADSIILAAQRSADLTGQLLAFARKGKVLSAPIDLHGSIAEVIGLLSRTIDRRISIEQDLAADPAVTVGDPAQLQTALLNLAINARDAMAGTGGTLRFATRRTTLAADAHGCGNAAGDFIEVAVSDTGCGMDATTMRHVFEPFFTTKPAGKGTGLGLAAVYGVVRSHAGTVAVQSVPGSGSTFRLWLPVAAMAACAVAEQQPVPTAGSGRILVIDDEAVVRTMLGDQLGELGFSVEACADGADAVGRLRAAGPDAFALVILDLVMPGLSGRETYERIRQALPEQRILLVSGHSLDSEAQTLLDQGAVGFLHKPLRMAELMAAVSSALSVQLR